MRIGEWVGLVCFLSLAGLGWWVLVFGWSWNVMAAGCWWLVLGILAAIRPNEWERRQR